MVISGKCVIEKEEIFLDLRVTLFSGKICVFDGAQRGAIET